MYDLIAFDMDGTLLNDEKRIDGASVEAMAEAVRAGKLVVLATGRAPVELRPYEADLGEVSYGVVASGAIIYDFRSGEILHRRTIDREVTEKIVEILRAEDVLSINMVDGFVYLERSKYEKIEKYFLEMYKELYPQVARFNEDMVEFLLAEAGNFEKINLFFRSPELRDKYYEILKDEAVTIIKTEKSGVEMTADGVDKAFGLGLLCDHLGLSMERVIAVGDSDNDETMIKAAGLGIAMGNANEKAMAAARAVVADNGHGGCAQAIYEYLLKE